MLVEPKTILLKKRKTDICFSGHEVCPSFQGDRGTRAAIDRDHIAPSETTPPMLQNMPMDTMAMTMAILTTMTTILATTMVTMVTIVTMVITMDTVTVTEDDHTAAWEITGKAPYIIYIPSPIIPGTTMVAGTGTTGTVEATQILPR